MTPPAQGVTLGLRGGSDFGRAKQKELTAAAQRLFWNDGGYIIPYFIQTIDASSTQVHGICRTCFRS